MSIDDHFRVNLKALSFLFSLLVFGTAADVHATIADAEGFERCQERESRLHAHTRRDLFTHTKLHVVLILSLSNANRALMLT